MDIRTIVLLFSLGIFVDANVPKYHYVVKNVGESIPAKIDDNWWRTAIFYQIYPRSFKDSNGDGMGDLQGIIEKLDHLKDMGVTAAWLSPIYKSPGIDQGYDISDYKDIDPIFGNLTDLKVLINKAHELGIKIIMDFVPNHTSDQHNWFQESVKNNATYKDYYIWSGTKKATPPNNWVSVFGGSAWTWNENRQQFYLHQFASAQPDLNYKNSEVVKAMKDVLNFWLNYGVDGFRMDAVPFIFEDSEFQNEPLSGAAGVDSSQYGYLKHIYTTNLDATYDMIYNFRSVLDDYNNKTENLTYSRIMMTEAYTDTFEQTARYYGNNTINGAQFTFNFNFITDITGNLTIDKIIRSTNKWLSQLEQKYVSNWVLGNHDQHRVATRFGTAYIDALNMLTAFLPGVQVTYMGEEIGMENGQVTCEQGLDPQAKNCSTFDQVSRDFERTPFQWDDSANAGFSTNSSTWLPVSNNYPGTNLKAQNFPGLKSHYNVYKEMVAFRENFKDIVYDAVSLIKLSNNILQIVRKTDRAEFVYLLNAGGADEDVRIYSDDVDYELVVASVSSNRTIGDTIARKGSLNLREHECLVLKVSPQSSGSDSLLSSSILGLLAIVFLIQFH